MPRARFWVPVAVVLFVNIAWSLIGIKMKVDRTESPTYTYHYRDYPEHWSLSRPAPPIAMVAEETVHYGVNTPEAMEEWATTQVDGGGFMTVGPPRRGFSVSMFHQLHCLRLVRWALGGNYDANAWMHVQHCLNYLRQDILCDSDVTLEPADILERDHKVERFGSIHVCRNWEALYSEGNDNWAQWEREQRLNATE